MQFLPHSVTNICYMSIKAWSVIQTKTEQSLFTEGSTATIAWSYKTKEYKKIKTYKKSVQREPKVKMSVNSRLRQRQLNFLLQRQSRELFWVSWSAK